MGKMVKICVVTMCLASLVNSSAFGGYYAGPGSGDFTYLGTSPTKWDPGLNTASFHGFIPPAGPMTPGGASWSAMATGVPTGAFDPHGAPGTPNTDIEGLVTPAADGLEYGIVNAALNVWAAASGFTNLGQVADSGAPMDAPEAASGHIGDIRVGAVPFPLPEFLPSVLAHAYQPGTAALFPGTPTIGGDAHFDVAEAWVDDPLDVAGNGLYDFYTVALHELGHSLGLGHEDTIPGAVMFPFYGGARRTLTPDDIAGIQALYGLPHVIPAPGAILLGAVGTGLVTWLRRRKTL